jgi:hypothetical protein
MDAFLSRSGIKDAKTDIAKAEVYLLAEPTATLKPEEVKRLMEDEYGYGFRSFKKHTDKKWEDFGVANR